ncbi:uncharacterized protein BYT42DRAFT_143764 [Radiomyces spectabilis]|uniref:uncharacterized protein n=1 Tax=Radiomyces spectabilis TaxID=64574 RepID=UPI0022211694|nr:uncharacterized protein BYT42DRAFT_143764 [Radiomyces spectabilis]KAI8366809.1 hypothetical protein BYT42DRAFT_143764 [Radiomyces spectabilis]
MSRLNHSNPRSLHSPSATSSDEEVDITEDPIDEGVIQCVCDSTDDDGFTIQCEKCLVWQHAFCVKIKKNNIPEHYLCNRCDRKAFIQRRSADSLKRRKGSSSASNALSLENKDVKRPLPPTDTSPSDNKRRATNSTDAKTKKQHFRDIYNSTRDNDEWQPRSATVKKPKLSQRIAVRKRPVSDDDEQDDEDLLGSPYDFSRVTVRKQKQKLAADKKSKMGTKSKVVRQIFKEGLEQWRDPKAATASQFVVMDSNTLLPSIPKASARPLWKSLHGAPLGRDDPSVRKGVFADIHIPADRFLMEVNGNVMLKSEYKCDPTNEFPILGTPRAHVIFYPSLDLCIDTKNSHSHVRYIRRSCHPNADVRCIVLPHAKDDQTIHLGVFTREHVDKGEEITIGWNWQRGHVAWKKSIEWQKQENGIKEPQTLTEDEKRDKLTAMQKMLRLFTEEFGECACRDKETCLIEYMKDEIEEDGDLLSDDGEGMKKKSGRSGSTKSPPFPMKTKGQTRRGSDAVSPKQKKGSASGKLSRPEMETMRLDTERLPRSDYTHFHDSDLTITNSHLPNKPWGNKKASLKHESGVSSAEEDAMEIDVTTTSPNSRRPSISVKDTESDSEILDIIGDTDASGFDNKDLYPSGPQSLDTHTRAAKVRRLNHGLTVSSASNGESLSPQKMISKLPCKKLWMRNYLQEKAAAEKAQEYPASNPSASSVKKEKAEISPPPPPQKDINIFSPSSSLKQEPVSTTDTSFTTVTAPSSSLPSNSYALTQEQEFDELMMDDGQLSVASSASTLPLDDGHRSDLDDANELSFKSMDDHQLLPSLEPSADPAAVDLPSTLPNVSESKDDDMVKSEQTENVLNDILQVEEEKTTDTTAPSASTVKEEHNRESNAEKSSKTVASEARSELTNPASKEDICATGANVETTQAVETKPVKIKLSLQEYLSRRATKGAVQESTPSTLPAEAAENIPSVRPQDPHEPPVVNASDTSTPTVSLNHV